MNSLDGKIWTTSAGKCWRRRGAARGRGPTTRHEKPSRAREMPRKGELGRAKYSMHTMKVTPAVKTIITSLAGSSSLQARGTEPRRWRSHRVRGTPTSGNKRTTWKRKTPCRNATSLMRRKTAQIRKVTQVRNGIA